MYHPQRNQNGPLERVTSGAVFRREARSLLLLSATGSGSKTALALPVVPYNVPPAYGVAFFPHHRYRACSLLLLWNSSDLLNHIILLHTQIFHPEVSFDPWLNDNFILSNLSSAPSTVSWRSFWVRGILQQFNSSVSQLCFQVQKLLDIQ